MKILLTGATGFLGKALLDELLKLESVRRIDVLSRRELGGLRHRDRRLESLKGDLTDLFSLQRLELHNRGIDQVIHLAGLYDFTSDFTSCYLHNVVATRNLLSALKERRDGKLPVFHHASTYAVAYTDSETMEVNERELQVLPPRSMPYAHTKALAEQVLAQSGLPYRIYRLGVLVGDTAQGRIEKLDGPYALLSAIRKLERLPGKPLLRVPLPVPADPETVIPLVPLDCAARALVEGAVRASAAGAGESGCIYGVYNARTAELRELVMESMARLVPSVAPVFLKNVPGSALAAGGKALGIPAANFAFASKRTRLENPRWQTEFGPIHASIPAFPDYQDAFFAGFREFAEGSPC